VQFRPYLLKSSLIGLAAFELYWVGMRAAGRIDWRLAPPDNFFEFAMFFVVVFMPFFVCALLTQALIRQPHAGWRRLALLIFVVTGIVGIAFAIDASQGWKVALSIPLAAASSICVGLFAQSLTQWLIQGFKGQA
jgi:hypothetical protein